MAVDEFRPISCDLPHPSAPDRENSLLLKTWIESPLHRAKTSPGSVDSSKPRQNFPASGGLVELSVSARLQPHTPLIPTRWPRAPFILRICDNCHKFFLWIRIDDVETTFDWHRRILKGYLPISWPAPTLARGVRHFPLAVFLPPPPHHHQFCP